MYKATLGADPELFLARKGEGQVPAFGLVGGTKEAPIQMPGYNKGFMYQEDGAAYEFNIPPTDDALCFVDSIIDAVQWASDFASKKGLTLSKANKIKLKTKYLEDPRSRTIGCSTDFCAYKTDDHERAPFNADELGTARFAGGHLHIGYNVEAVPHDIAAKFLDLYLGLPSVMYDKQAARRSFYGKAGLYRPKTYGIEYRTLSNAWLWLNRDHQHNLALDALRFAESSFNPKIVGMWQQSYAYMPWSDVAQAIEKEDAVLAKSLYLFASKRFVGTRLSRLMEYYV